MGAAGAGQAPLGTLVRPEERLAEMVWLDPVLFARAAQTGLIRTGAVLEVVTLNDMNAIDGTALFEVEGVYKPDEHGVMLEVLSRGASSTARAVEFEIAFEKGARHRACLHLCSHTRAGCTMPYPPARVSLHADSVRVRNVKGITEPWAKLPAAIPALAVNEAENKVKDLKRKLAEMRNETPRDRLVRAAGGAVTGESRKHRKKKKRGKKSRDGSSSSSETSDRDDGNPLLGKASGDARMDIRGIASAHPGLLYEQGLQEVATQMGLAGAGGAGAATLSQVQIIPTCRIA